MTATIQDVAALAGVSVATVSRALRGLPHVAPATRQRVLRAAADLHYVAHPLASRLAAGRSDTVGMVVPLLSQWFFSHVVCGAEAVLAAAGYELLLYTVGGPIRREHFLAAQPFRRRVDGIIAVGLPFDDEAQSCLAGSGTPVVAVGISSAHFSTVTIDNVAAAATATRHLVNLGHQRIGLIGNLADDARCFGASRERREGYRQALREHGLEVRTDLQVRGSFSLRGGMEAMAQLLAADRPPSAVFAQSDEMAIGALRTVSDSGLRVPEDISLVGFDDHDMAEVLGLTTVAQPVVEQGETAAGLLLKMMGGEEAGPLHTVLPTVLRVRTTTGPCRVPFSSSNASLARRFGRSAPRR